MKSACLLSVFLLNAMISFAEEIPGRTDLFYDSGRNVIFSTASVNPDYNTQYYYKTAMTTFLTKMGLTQSMGFWGYNEGEEGSGSTYAEASGEPGVEFTAVTYHRGIVRYMTYEMVYGCSDCYDWYDAYGYWSISGTGDPTQEGPTFSVWVWAAPIIVARIIEQMFDIGQSGGKLRAPGDAVDFDVEVRSFIPAPWVFSPTVCDGYRELIHKGDNRSFQALTSSVRTRSKVISLPNQGSFVSTSKYTYTGQTRQYDKATGLAPDGVTLLDDSVLNDCYKLNATGFASTANMHIDVTGDASSRRANARFYGGANNPLVASPEINWDVLVVVSTWIPASPHYTISFTHDCFPAHEVYIGKQRIHEWTPTSYTVANVASCLGGFAPVRGGPNEGTIFP